MMDIASIPMRHTLTSRFAFLAVLAVLFTSACGADPTAPTPDPIEQSYLVYSGPLDPDGKITNLFPLSVPGTVQLMLAGVTLNNPLRAISPTLHLEIARWNGAECEAVTAVDTAPKMTTALQVYLTAGSYCAIVSDAGALAEPVSVTMRLVSPALVRAGGGPGTASFASTVTPGGTSTRTFEASVPGKVTLSLNSLSAGGVQAGLGVGILATDGSACWLAQVVHAVAGVTPPLTVDVDAGLYCAGVFDVGNFTKNESFSMTIGHP